VRRLLRWVLLRHHRPLCSDEWLPCRPLFVHYWPLVVVPVFGVPCRPLVGFDWPHHLGPVHCVQHGPLRQLDGPHCVEAVLGMCGRPLWELDGPFGVDLHRRVRHRNILCCWSERLLELPSRKVRIIDGLFCLRLLLGRVLLRHHRPLGSHGTVHFRQVLKRWCQLVLVVCCWHF